MPVPQVPLTGIGGHSQRLLMRPQYKDPDDPRNAMPIGGSPGKYRVTYTFGRPGYAPVPEREFSMDETIPGDSHLAIMPPAVPPPPQLVDATNIRVYSTVDGEEIVFDGYPNARGFLGRLEATIDANDFKHAEVKSYRSISPSLSNWSIHLDVPFWIWRCQITELASGAAQITITNPFPDVPFALSGEGQMTAEFRAFASLYREALGTNSPAYAFLCLFKIAEGVRKRRQRIAAELLARGHKPTRPVERIPASDAEFRPWLDALFPKFHAEWDELTLEAIFVREARGRKINDLLDKELADLRNDIGHALSDESGEPSLVVDEAMHLDRVHRWLQLMRCVVRRMLKNEFPQEFLTYLREEGERR